MIILKKDGMFYENDINPEHEDYIYRQIDSIVQYLDEYVEIEDGYTLRDFFDMLDASDAELMQLVFSSQLGRHPILPFLEEINQDCMPENRDTEMECIECSWVAEQFDYRKFYEDHKDDEDSIAQKLEMELHEPDEDDENEISIYVDVHGLGPQPQKNSDALIDPHAGPDDVISYGIEFTPLHKISHLPIVLNTNFVMYGVNDHGNNKPLIEGKRGFTVFEIVGSLLSEISFCGLPEERDAQWRDILDTVEEAKEQMDNDEDDENDGDE